MKRSLGLLVFTFATLAASQAFAQAISGPQGEIYGELSLSVNDYDAGTIDVGTGILIAPLFGGYYRVAPQLALSVDWGFGVYNLSSDATDDSEGAFLVGNPTIGGHYLTGSGPMTARIGVLLALPVASLSDDDLSDAFVQGLGYQVALGARGFWDAWLYLAETFSLMVPGRIETRLGQNVAVAGEGAIGLLVPTDGGDSRDNELLGQLGGEIAYVASGVRAGFRLRGAWVVTGDLAQVAMEPFIQLGIGSSAWFRARFTINLDDPYGFSFDDSGIWGLHLAIGGNL